ncbi:phage integrase family protein [Pseudonocardia hierapolitana]|uniref:Phage integrase family protein n=1 Tax=Pseudonocardia hierapolitana TaxID=1128676 RepID=A0A561SP80_9PSEU|nr:GntR family transcriptional regulator [Pseudonocardia hierapolitana]TWF76643.1 phage integrase family protein [Pseudonocardia hierapolitana]
MDRYLELLDVEETTLERYEQTIRIHIRPLLGHLPVAKLDGETLDAHQAILRRCRAHCDGRPHVGHAADGPHNCSPACRPHVCQPLATSTIRKVHFCLSGALARAVRWRWITVNPLDQAEPPRGPRSDPDSPTAEQATAILNAAFPEVMWGCLLWLAMTTGARRGELCAMRRDRLDLDRAVLTIRTSIAQKNTLTWEKDTKTHQQRRIALDDNTVSLFRAYRQQCEQDAAAVGITLAPDGRLFSPAVDHSTWLRPSSVSNRYARMCARFELAPAPPLFGDRADRGRRRRPDGCWPPRARRRRLNHASRIHGVGGGGRPTGDEGAGRPHAIPPISSDGGPGSTRRPELLARDSPSQRIAADLRAAIACGALTAGDPLPTIDTLRERYKVAAGTANRAVALLKAEGLVAASRGKRAVVAAPPQSAAF